MGYRSSYIGARGAARRNRARTASRAQPTHTTDTHTRSPSHDHPLLVLLPIPTHSADRSFCHNYGDRNPEGCQYSDLALQRSSAIVGKMPRMALRFLYLAVLAPSPPHRIGNADTTLRISPFSWRRPPSTTAALRGPYIEKQMQLEFRHMQATSRQTRSRASRSSPRSITEASALLTSSVQKSRGFRQVAGWPASPYRRDRRSRPELRPGTDPRPRV
jgi:hypothetical protein